MKEEEEKKKNSSACNWVAQVLFLKTANVLPIAQKGLRHTSHLVKNAKNLCAQESRFNTINNFLLLQKGRSEVKPACLLTFKRVEV